MNKLKAEKKIQSEAENFDEILKKEFIGKNYDKIMTKNKAPLWLGLFFGPIWFFYRKMYLYGFIIILCLMLVNQVLAHFEITPSISVVFSIIYLFVATPIYLHHIERKIIGIKNNFPSADEETLIALVRKAGGTSTVALIIYLVIFFSLFLMVIL